MSEIRRYLRRIAGPALWLRRSWRERQRSAPFRGVQSYCLFVGPRRSGTTLIGQLLNAHPNMVISHQLYALDHVDGLTRSQHFQRILDRDQKFVNELQCRWNGYDYRVAGQWQGRFTQLRVIGDKGAHKATRTIHRDPGILQRLERKTGIAPKFVMVVRNPFDVIGNFRRHNFFPTVGEAVDDYFEVCAAAAELMASTPQERWFHLRLESFVHEPAKAVRGLCAFFGVECTDEYVEACCRGVFPSARNTRQTMEWDEETIRDVEERIERFPFLSGYRFGEDVPAASV